MFLFSPPLLFLAHCPRNPVQVTQLAILSAYSDVPCLAIDSPCAPVLLSQGICDNPIYPFFSLVLDVTSQCVFVGTTSVSAWLSCQHVNDLSSISS